MAVAWPAFFSTAIQVSISRLNEFLVVRRVWSRTRPSAKKHAVVGVGQVLGHQPPRHRVGRGDVERESGCQERGLRPHHLGAERADRLNAAHRPGVVGDRK